MRHAILAARIIATALAVAAAPASAQGLSVTIDAPLDGAVVFDTLVVSGTSTGAAVVTLVVDEGADIPVNGVEDWNHVFEPGSLSPGDHVLTARAEDDAGNAVTDDVSIVVNEAVGTESIVYTSSVDGEALGADLYLPLGFDPEGPPVPLVMVLHGGGGDGQVLLNIADGALRQELDVRGWIGIAPDGREWGLADMNCPWRTSSGYVDLDDPDVGPGEQDMLDAIDWVQANYPVDPDRIYLTGNSMGGRGTYIIGLKNPDRFAAIGPGAPATDMFEIFDRRPEPRVCKEGMVGGAPGDSLFVDTMYKVTSGRFLLENAYNLPVFHGHGLLDLVATNDRDNPIVDGLFLHGWHVTLNGSWSRCHPGTDFCFGHTPTLAELRLRHPAGYDWAHMFSPVGHESDPRWFVGAETDPQLDGVEDPQNPGQLLNMFEFFSRRTLVRDPDTVVFKTFEDQHRKAYWAEIDISTPWLDLPGAVRATRTIAENRLRAELVRVDRATFDLTAAGLQVAPGEPFTVTVERLREPAYDPALDAPGEMLEPTLVLRQEAPSSRCVTVEQDGAPFPKDRLLPDPAGIEIGPLTVDGATTFTVETIEDPAFDCDGDGLSPEGGDCDDVHRSAFPGAVELCDGFDNDCGGLIDEGFDHDGDGVASCTDTCPNLADPGQDDGDGDGIGDLCEEAVVNANVEATGASALRVDGSDLFVLARSFGLCIGAETYDGRSDLDRDGCVDGSDLSLMSGVWGAAVP